MRALSFLLSWGGRGEIKTEPLFSRKKRRRFALFNRKQTEHFYSIFGYLKKPLIFLSTDSFFKKKSTLTKSEFLFFHSSGSSALLSDLCLQAARGMAYLESKGIIHRDLAAR